MEWSVGFIASLLVIVGIIAATIEWGFTKASSNDLSIPKRARLNKIINNKYPMVRKLFCILRCLLGVFDRVDS